MGEAISVFVIIIGFVLGIRGIYLVYINRSELELIFGIKVSLRILSISLLFFIFIFSLYLFLTYLNGYYGFVDVIGFKNFRSLGADFLPSLSSAILEEFYFRIILFYSLIGFVRNKIIVVLVVSVIFSLFHMTESSLAFLSYFLGGVMYGYSYLKFQNITIPIGIHFSWNFIQGAIFGYPVSGHLSDGFITLSIIPNIFYNGGIQGPEVSVAGVIMRMLIIFLVYFISYRTINVKFLTQDTSF